MRVVAISIAADDALVRKWLLEHATSFQILRDPNGVVAEQLGMRVMPTSFLIDSRGVVRARHEGFRDEDEPAIEAEMRGLLAGGWSLASIEAAGQPFLRPSNAPPAAA